MKNEEEEEGKEVTVGRGEKKRSQCVRNRSIKSMKRKWKKEKK